MAAASVVSLSRKSQDKLIAYYSTLQENQNITREELRSKFEEADKNYQREKDLTQEQQRAKSANKGGDADRFQNMTIPIVMPQVEAAVVYQTSVFLTGQPIFGVVADPAYMDSAMQLETVLDNQSVKGGWARQLMMFFRDGFKYNFSALEVAWGSEVTYAVETDLTVNSVEGIPTKVIWSGNTVRRLDPYNVFVDTRVAPCEVYKDGEFAGFTELMSRIKLKAFIAALPDKIIANVRPAFESGKGSNNTAGSMNFYSPTINPDVDESSFMGDGSNWMSWAGLQDDKPNAIQYKDSYEVTTLYCRILPADFDINVPASNTPQVYKLHIVNHQHIIYAELQTNAHGYLGILIGQPLEDGLQYQTKSLAANGSPFQALASSYMNSIIASRRRAVTDRVLYDPSRITAAAINSSNPSAKIPVRPAAYGKNIGDAVHQFPYREDQAASSMQQISTIVGLANSLTGQNQAQQGQFVKGNKTLHEFESVMQNANGRDQLTSILLEHQVFVPLKTMLKVNILQYQGGTTLYNKDSNKVIEVDPIALRKAILDFKVSDGLTPASKLLNTDAWTTALQVMGSSPQIANNYNVGGLFSYLMKTQGAKITEFEKSQPQLAYEQALGAWQSMTQLAIEKGMDPAKVGAQPLPQAYGYNPENNSPAPESAKQPSSTQTSGVV